MARRNIRRANPSRWTPEGRLLRKRLGRGDEQPAPAPEAEAAPVVEEDPAQVVEATVVEVQEAAAEPARKPVRRRRRRSKSSAD